MILFEMTQNLFSMSRYEVVLISTVTAAALLGIRSFVKQYTNILSWIVIAMAVGLAEYRMNFFKGLFTMSKSEVSVLIAAGIVAFYGGSHLIDNVRRQWTERKLRKFSKTPKDVVILHGFSRPRTIPNVSPFVLKVETFLRMSKIKYEVSVRDKHQSIRRTWIDLYINYFLMNPLLNSKSV
jgi:hypothetical protein